MEDSDQRSIRLARNVTHRVERVHGLAISGEEKKKKKRRRSNVLLVLVFAQPTVGMHAQFGPLECTFYDRRRGDRFFFVSPIVWRTVHAIPKPGIGLPPRFLRILPLDPPGGTIERIGFVKGSISGETTPSRGEETPANGDSFPLRRSTNTLDLAVMQIHHIVDPRFFSSQRNLFLYFLF